jgi:hypothetical protein
MGTGYAAPMGLFSLSGRCYKHSAPNGAGVPNLLAVALIYVLKKATRLPSCQRRSRLNI